MLIFKQMNISFFTANPNGDGVVVDHSVMFSIRTQDFVYLSCWEQAFVQWYLNETESGLLVLHVSGKNPGLNSSRDITLDMSQEDLCRNFMSMIRAETVEDPDFF
jgi:hypothetical protein